MCKTSIFQSWILFLKSSNNQTDLNPYFRIKMLAIKKQVLAPLPDHFVSSDESLILIVFKPFYTLIIVLNENRSALWPIKFPEPLIKWPLGSGLNHCSYDHYCLVHNPWTPIPINCPAKRWWENSNLSGRSCYLDLTLNSLNWFTRKCAAARGEN